MSSAADFTDTARAEERLRAAANKLHELVPAVAKARQIKEFAGDRRKMLLASYVAPLLIDGKTGVAAAEHIARANLEYQLEFKTHSQHYEDACATIAEWEATQATYDAARSLLSFSKEHLRTMEG